VLGRDVAVTLLLISGLAAASARYEDSIEQLQHGHWPLIIPKTATAKIRSFKKGKPRTRVVQEKATN
jgi:hypothetical protein